MKKVYCIGELLIDFVAENQGKDLTQAVQFTKKAGGAPANVACAISKLGGSAVFVGAVGQDAFGQFLVDTLHFHGVDTSEAQRSQTFTTLAFVSIAADGERDFVFSRGADKTLTYQSSLGKQLNEVIVHFGAATSFLGGSLEEAYGRYLSDAKQGGCTICFDPNFRTDLWKNNEETFVTKCHPYIAAADLCKFSHEEALLLSGKNDLPEACAYLHQLGCPVICVTLGAEGTWVSTPTSAVIVASVPAQAVDTTGAGDAFIGCLLQQLAETNAPKETLRQEEQLLKMVAKANKAGAFTTQKFGAIAALPTQADLGNY